MPQRTIPDAPAYVDPRPPPALHPYARHPYAPRPVVDPRYVGPAWAAPAPRSPSPAAAPRAPAKPRAKGGCLAAALSLFLLGAAVAAVFALTYFGGGNVEPPAIGVAIQPTATAPVPSATVTPLQKPEITQAWQGGACYEASKERNEDEYTAWRNNGSAPRLRGKVAMLHVRLGGGQASWPKSLVLKIDEAALLSQKFYLDQAKRYGVRDLTYEVIPWSLVDAVVNMPSLAVDPSKRLPEATERRLHDESEKAIETAFGSSLESIVASYRKKGYDGVGFLVYLPPATDARDFAWPSPKLSLSTDPEIGILFPRTDALAPLSVTVAHEGMHLFGADDLYRMRAADKRDLHDVMGDYCSGFRQALVGETTAYAVGWLAAPPARPYRISDH